MVLKNREDATSSLECALSNLTGETGTFTVSLREQRRPHEGGRDRELRAIAECRWAGAATTDHGDVLFDERGRPW